MSAQHGPYCHPGGVRSYGNPEWAADSVSLLQLTDEELCRFWRHVGVVDRCVQWLGYPNQAGYGIWACRGVRYRVHRVAYTLERGPIPIDMLVLHKPPCNNRLCVQHTYIGTYQNNSDDTIKSGNARHFGMLGDYNPASVLTSETAKEIRDKYVPRKYSSYRLADEYNITHTQVLNVVHGRHWK